MSIKKVNEIFRTKYPEGEIFSRGQFGGVPSSRIAVIFKQCGKVYEYSCANYYDLLNRLGFKIISKDEEANYKRSIQELKDRIDRGYENTIFREGGKHYYTDKDIEEMNKEILRYEAVLKEYKVV